VITVERYCTCGEKLSAKAADEDEAREKLTEFLQEHIGREDDGTLHKPMKRKEYWRMIRKAQAEMKASAEAQAKKFMQEQIAQAPKVRRYATRRQ
jgi:hypothetical protein